MNDGFHNISCTYLLIDRLLSFVIGGPLMLGSRQVGISSFIAKDHNGGKSKFYCVYHPSSTIHCLTTLHFIALFLSYYM